MSREMRTDLTTNNIVDLTLANPQFVFDSMEYVLDNPELDIPDVAATVENVVKLMELQSYYANLQPYVTNLFGVLHVASKARAGSNVEKMRDYMEKCISACSKKYDAASRLLTGYQSIYDLKGDRKF